MRPRREIVVWALIVAIGAAATSQVRRIDAAFAVGKPDVFADKSVAALVKRAQIGSSSLGPGTQQALSLATKLGAFQAPAAVRSTRADYVAPAQVDKNLVVASISQPNGPAEKLRAAMQQATVKGSALAGINAATGGLNGATGGVVSAYGEIPKFMFADRRLTILQIGDSHTAADFFSGRVRDRVQQAFGDGGDVFLAPGRPHPGVLSALFSTTTSGDWSYEALQRSDDKRRLHLSGFNAVARAASATMTLTSRGGRVYDHADVSFLEQPGGGKAEVLLDGETAGEVSLDGGSGQEVTFDAHTKTGEGFRRVEVRSLDDQPVAVTGVEVGRRGEGVSYLSIGYPGATVQLLQKLDNSNLAEDIQRLAPDMVVLAFGTNEGFNDNLDVNAYISQYEQIVRRLQALRPGLKVVMVGPADAARPSGMCHAAGVGQHCNNTGSGATPSMEASGNCRYPIPPKLGMVREAQRKLAVKLGVAFWDWSTVQGGPCGAQAWAAANPPLMAGDFVHMTLAGYKQSADRFADFLIPLIQGRPAATHVVSNN